MTKIRDIFDPAKRIDRRIEKVITIEMTDEDLLKQEIQEYVVTDSISANFERLLDAVDEGMSANGVHEVGVWVSGFYGSGKSSFIKNLGFALDPNRKLGGEPFLKWLQNQFASQPLRQRLGVVAKKHPAVVIMIDLASQAFAGAAQESIANVLYYSVMQWAGYSKDKKVAYFEFMLERDNKIDAFKARISEMTKGKSWDEIKNQPLAVKTFASRLASEFYPEIWPDSKSFNEVKIEEAWKEDERVQEMLDLIRRKAGTDKIIFVLDEVGQYIASRDDLILNLDGLAKNIKNIGRGKVWLIATAQQTLTEDDPRAVLNSPKLFKLQARFPMWIDLEAGDIREICYKRLLGKSAEGDKEVAGLFKRFGPQLQLAVELKNTRYYSKELDETTFRRLYPFLPQHFDILLELLGRLARTSGGIGLRSAIKVIQDVLVDQSKVRPGADLLADAGVGELAAVPVFYDTLERDIQRSFRHIIEGVRRTETVFGKDSMEVLSGKTIAVLQVLEDFPITRQNVAALLHPSVSSPSLVDQVGAAVDNMLNEQSVPINELDGRLRFVSEAVGDLEKEKTKIMPRVADTRSIFNTALKDVLTPAPNSRLQGVRAVSTGFKVYAGAMPVSLSGEREEIQTHILFSPEKEYEKTKEDKTFESTKKAGKDLVFLIARENPELEDMLVEIYRCRTLYSQNRNKAGEKEVEEYLRSQLQRADQLTGELQNSLRKALEAGSFIFRGRQKAVTEYKEALSDAMREMLSENAEKVFEYYSQAPIQADSGLAERFLKTDKLDRISSKDDPLELVKRKGGTVGINVDQEALVSIRDYLDRLGQVDGRKLLDDFYRAPYGWSKDTTRYLVAAMLVGGVIKFRVGGQDVTVRGDMAVGAIKNTNSFNKVGVALREGGPPPEARMRASQRLLALTGEQVLPLEEEISKAVSGYFPDLQKDYAALSVQLSNLELPGVDRAEAVQEGLTEILKGDASDASVRLGQEECPLYEDLQWAAQVKKAFDNKIGEKIGESRFLISEIPQLPSADILGEIVSETEEDRNSFKEYLERDDFYTLQAEIGNRIADIQQVVKAKTQMFVVRLREELETEKALIQSSFEWGELGEDDRVRFAGELDSLQVEDAEDLNGLKRAVNKQYSNQAALKAIREEIKRIIEEQRKDSKVLTKDMTGKPRIITSEDQLKEIITDLEELKNDLKEYEKIILKWE
jgi:hypothetical protein